MSNSDDELNDDLNIIPASDIIIPLPLASPISSSSSLTSLSLASVPLISPPRTPVVRAPRIVPTVQAGNLPQNSPQRQVAATPTRTGSRIQHRIVPVVATRRSPGVEPSITQSISQHQSAQTVPPTSAAQPVLSPVTQPIASGQTTSTPQPTLLQPAVSTSQLASSVTQHQPSQPVSPPMPTSAVSPPIQPTLPSVQSPPLFDYTPPTPHIPQSVQPIQSTPSQPLQQSQALIPVQSVITDKLASIPNYDAMPLDQQIFHRADFGSKYAIIRQLLPGRIVPSEEEIRTLPLRHLHIQHDVHYRDYEVIRGVNDYKNKFKMGWAFLEVGVMHIFNINIKDYVKSQIQNLNDYELIFQQLSDRDYRDAQNAKIAATVTGIPLEPESLESQLFKATLKNTAMFIAAKYLADSFRIPVGTVEGFFQTMFRVAGDVSGTPVPALPSNQPAAQPSAPVQQPGGGFGNLLGTLMNPGTLGVLGGMLPGLITMFTGGSNQAAAPQVNNQPIQAAPAIYDD